MVPSSDPSESFEPGQWPDSQKRDLLPTLEQSAKDPAEWIQRRQQSRVLLGPIEPMRNPSGVEAAVEAGVVPCHLALRESHFAGRWPSDRIRRHSQEQ